MTGFLDIDKIVLPLSCIDEVYSFLRYAGSKNVEGVALWAGIVNESTFEIKQTIIPKQTAYKQEMGLLYSVEGDQLHEINVWLYKNKLTLIAQIHSHPNEAYHSDTDDMYPIVAMLGGLSIVIPNFASDEFKLEDWAVYRLLQGTGWTELSFTETKSLFKII